MHSVLIAGLLILHALPSIKVHHCVCVPALIAQIRVDRPAPLVASSSRTDDEGSLIGSMRQLLAANGIVENFPAFVPGIWTGDLTTLHILIATTVVPAVVGWKTMLNASKRKREPTTSLCVPPAKLPTPSKLLAARAWTRQHESHPEGEALGTARDTGYVATVSGTTTPPYSGTTSGSSGTTSGATTPPHSGTTSGLSGTASESAIGIHQGVAQPHTTSDAEAGFDETLAKPTRNVAGEVRIYVRAIARELMQQGLLRGMHSCRDAPAEYWKIFTAHRSPEFLADTKKALQFADTYFQPASIAVERLRADVDVEVLCRHLRGPILYAYYFLFWFLPPGTPSKNVRTGIMKSQGTYFRRAHGHLRQSTSRDLSSGIKNARRALASVCLTAS